MTDTLVSRYSDSWSAPAAPDLGDPVTRRELSPAAVITCSNIFDLWRLSVGDSCRLLGGVSTRTWERWREDPDKVLLDQDQLTRASLILGIHRALRTIYSREYADAWVTIPDSHPLFAGMSPVDAMARGGIPTMQSVRQLLDGWRGGR